MLKILNKYQNTAIAALVAGLATGSILFIGASPVLAGYGQGSYEDGGFYSQGSYYSQSGYYAQGSYGPATPMTYSFEYEPNGYCVRVTVVKKNSHPRTVIHSDGFNVACDEIETSARALQRSVELTY